MQIVPSLRSVVECVRGVGQVVVEVLQRALASDDGLHEEAEDRNHGKAAVLELLHL